MSVSYSLNELEALFSKIQEELKQEISDESFFENFITPLKVLEVVGNTIFLSCPNEFKQLVLTQEHKDLFEKKFEAKFGNKINVIFLTDKKLKTKINPKNQNNGLFKNYTFDNFVIGDFNKSAYNALKLILKNPKWNPIFITGGVGLGKTHLLHAIGNEFLNQFPNKSVRYITSNDFIRNVYDCFSEGNNVIEKLINEYFNYDLLLIDDVQFFSKKEKICEIFFNIFNHNVNNDQLLIMTSDKTPSQLENFEDRIKSRFSSGLLVTISKPDLESVKQIFDKKITDSGHDFIFNKDAVSFIVRRYQNDIRRLEGCLHRIFFYCINNLPPNAIITIETVKTAINEDSKEEIKKFGYDVDPDLVIEEICLAYSVDVNNVKSKIQTKQITFVRHVCMYVLRKKFNMSFQQIGSFFGREHSTIIDGVKKIEKILSKNDQLNEFIENLYKNV